MARAKTSKPASGVARKRGRPAVVKTSAAERTSPPPAITAPRPVGRPRKDASAAAKPSSRAAGARRSATPAAKTVRAAVPDVTPAAIAPSIAEAVAAVEPIIETATKGSDMAAATETYETLKQNGEASAERIQALFGDVNGRAKTALEKRTSKD